MLNTESGILSWLSQLSAKYKNLNFHQYNAKIYQKY